MGADDVIGDSDMNPLAGKCPLPSLIKVSFI